MSGGTFNSTLWFVCPSISLPTPLTSLCGRTRAWSNFAPDMESQSNVDESRASIAYNYSTVPSLLVPMLDRILQVPMSCAFCS